MNKTVKWNGILLSAVLLPAAAHLGEAADINAPDAAKDALRGAGEFPVTKDGDVVFPGKPEISAPLRTRLTEAERSTFMTFAKSLIDRNSSSVSFGIFVRHTFKIIGDRDRDGTYHLHAIELWRGHGNLGSQFMFTVYPNGKIGEAMETVVDQYGGRQMGSAVLEPNTKEARLLLEELKFWNDSLNY